MSPKAWAQIAKPSQTKYDLPTEHKAVARLASPSYVDFESPELIWTCLNLQKQKYKKISQCLLPNALPTTVVGTDE